MVPRKKKKNALLHGYKPFKCQRWTDHRICAPHFLKPVTSDEILCLRNQLLDSNNQSSCKTLIRVRDQISHVQHLTGNVFGYSCRGYLKVVLVCLTLEGLIEKPKILQGLGQFEMPDNCHLSINGLELPTRFSKIMFINGTDVGKFHAEAISELFLAQNLAWRDFGNTIFHANLTQLRSLEAALSKEASFQGSHTAMNMKTLELLNQTQLLISKADAETEWFREFERPAFNDLIVWLILLLIVMYLSALFYYFKSKLHSQVAEMVGKILSPLSNLKRSASERNSRKKLEV